MVNREKYSYVTGLLREIGTHYDSDDFRNAEQRLQQTVDSFDIKILIVGHFNAGKSALLNGLIGKSLLRERQLPETAIATELKYGESDEFYAYLPDGEKISVSPKESIQPGQYDHLEYIVHSDGLKTISDFTIVDTPGFDSAIEEHTKALSGYIGLGSGYLLVIDAEKGGIDNTSLNFLAEISQYSKHVAVLINKCDKMTDNNINLILKQVNNTLALNGYYYPVYSVSKYDADIMEKMDNIILMFDAQHIFDETVQKNILSEAQSMYSVLKIIDSKLYLNTYEMDEQIRINEEAREHLASTFNAKKGSEIYNINQETEQVITQVRSALIKKAGSISEAILRGSTKGAEAIIIGTVRPVIIDSMKSIVSNQIDSITRSLDFSGMLTEDDGRAIEDIFYDLANDLKLLIDQGVFESTANKTKGVNRNAMDMYHVVTGIASIATDVVEPWMEVIIILLPDIISLVTRLCSEAPEDKAERLFVDEVTPQICNQLYPQIQDAVEENLNTVTDELQTMMDEKFISIRQNIEQAKKNKEKTTEQFNEYKYMIKRDMNELQNVVKDMEAV